MNINVYLQYIDNRSENKYFSYATILPFFWQEIYSLELLERQEHCILNALEKSTEKKSPKFIVRIEEAIRNLEHKNQANSIEKNQNKTLRNEFIDFLKKEVKPNTNLEIQLENLLEVYGHPEKLVQDLKDFHTNQKKRIAYQKEKLSFRFIGYNEDFKSFSPTYRLLTEEYERNLIINKERRKALEKHKNSAEKINKKADFTFLLSALILILLMGVYLLFQTNLIAIGVFFLLIVLLGGIYLTKKKSTLLNRKKENN